MVEWLLHVRSNTNAFFHRYFLALAFSDLLVCIFHIPVITTITGCTFSSYGEAFYFTHFGWTMVGV